MANRNKTTTYEEIEGMDLSKRLKNFMGERKGIMAFVTSEAIREEFSAAGKKSRGGSGMGEGAEYSDNEYEGVKAAEPMKKKF